MNDIIDTIISRRSTRDFSNILINRNILEKIIKIAHHTPSGMNAQTRFFLVIQKKEEIVKLNNIIYKCIINSKNKQFFSLKDYVIQEKDVFYQSTNLIFVFNKYHNDSSEPKIDAALSMYNILLTAHTLNIKSCWINVVQLLYKKFFSFRKYFLSYVNIYEYFLIGCVALGYAKEEKNENIKNISYNYKILE